MKANVAIGKEKVSRFSLRLKSLGKGGSAGGEQDEMEPQVMVSFEYDKTSKKVTYAFDFSELNNQESFKDWSSKDWYCRVRISPGYKQRLRISINGNTGKCVLENIPAASLRRGVSLSLYSLDQAQAEDFSLSGLTKTPSPKRHVASRPISTRPLVENSIGILPVQSAPLDKCLWRMNYGSEGFDPVVEWNQEISTDMLRDPKTLATILPSIVNQIALKMLEILRAEEEESAAGESDDTEQVSPDTGPWSAWERLIFPNGVPELNSHSDLSYLATTAVGDWCQRNPRFLDMLADLIKNTAEADGGPL